MDLSDAYRMGTELLQRHGLDGWSLAFDNAKRRAGVCRHGSRVIGLSAPLARLHSVDEVRETLLHEIAHALAGPEHGHDAVWVARARAIGSTGERCLPEEAPRPAAPWLGVCPAGHRVERHRRPERVASCLDCSPTFSTDHVLEWTHYGRPGALHPNYLLELRSLREGRPMRLARPGQTVRLLVPGPLHGRVGRVVRLGRTSYHVDLPDGRYRVLFAAAERVDAAASGPDGTIAACPGAGSPR